VEPLPVLRVDRGGRTAEFHGTWYRGSTTNFIPSKADLRDPDAVDRFVLHGWAPSAPLITRAQRILAFGSCFATHVTDYLSERGFHVLARDLDLTSHVIRCGEGMVNTFAIRQQFEWALEGRAIPDGLWFSEHKEICAVDPAIQAETRDTILSADAFILTLGLSEIWYDKRNGEVLWRAVPAHLFDESTHGFRVSSIAENYANLVKIRELIRSVKPAAPIVLTLSPVPLLATFRPVSCLTASSVSKAILRVAIDELMRNFSEDRALLYFPAYEIVKDFCVDAYHDDNRHPKPEVVAFVMETFERAYCDG
jgi:hypothetical protein